MSARPAFALTAAPLVAVALVATAAAHGGPSKRDAGATTDAETTPDAGTSISKIPPDPPALSERKQWVFDLRYDRGDIYLVSVHSADMGAPHATPRVMGRFALELYEGPTLIERARFDFPMLGAPDVGDGGFRAPPRIEPKLRTRIGVFFPATAKGNRLELWDRARDLRWRLPWPPTEGPVAPDGGGAAR